MLLDGEIEWKSFDTYIFDLDGTLVDSLNQIERSLDLTRAHFGYMKSPKGQVFKNLGLPLRELFSDLEMSHNKQNEFITYFRKDLAEQVSISNQLFTGVFELIRLIRSYDIRIAIATSKPTYLANQVIHNSEIRGMIDFIQGTDDFSPKPDPEVIRRCITALESKNGIMIGDRQEDVFAASSAGIPSIGIAQSSHDTEMLISAGASHAFLTIKDFLDRFKNNS